MRDIAFTGIYKLYGPEISPYLHFMLQILDNLRQLSIFSNYIGEIDPFTLTFRKGPTAGPSEEFLIPD